MDSHTTSQPLTLRINDAAKALGIGRSSIYRLINQGKLRTVKIAGRTLVPATEVHRIVDRAIAEAKAGA